MKFRIILVMFVVCTSDVDCSNLRLVRLIRDCLICQCLTVLSLVLVCQHCVCSALNMWAVIVMLFSGEYVWEQQVSVLKELSERV